MAKRLTQREWTSKCRNIHGDKYLYPEPYTGSQIKICIVCTIHGAFPQTPSSHLSGSGCPKCKIGSSAVTTPKSFEKFVTDCRRTHGDKFLYSPPYVNGLTPVSIVCPVHGQFYQKPTLHLSGSGCPECGAVSKAKLRTKTHETFEADCRAVHGSAYDYPESYKSVHSKIKIICKEHGPFWQTPNKHLCGAICPKCVTRDKPHANIMRNEQHKADFLRKCSEQHGDRYKYPEIYVRASSKIKIICAKHGVFSQTPSSHLAGHGCPDCSYQKSRSQTEWLDALGIPIREYQVPGVRGKVDGYDPHTNTVYEFHGSFWHGDPSDPRYQHNKLNPVRKLTYGELYRRTKAKEAKLAALGYKLCVMWESEWEALKKISTRRKNIVDT